VANVSAADLKETDGRTNVLIIGLDRRNDGKILTMNTDTLVVTSIGRVEGDIVLISLPRDLWVQNPTGGFGKINSMYYYGGGDNGGAQNLQKVVENVLGLPIHYYVVVDFDIFKETINTLGGIDVNVENSFTDYEYPIDFKELDMCGKSQEVADKQVASGQPLYTVYPCRYETLKFQAGMQKMDAETALKYARSRHATTADEYTDFARAKRQQNIITAVKNKALSMNTLFNPSKLKELFDTYAKNVQTNIDFPTMQGFYLLSQQVKFDTIKSIVLDDRSSADVGGLYTTPRMQPYMEELTYLSPEPETFPSCMLTFKSISLVLNDIHCSRGKLFLLKKYNFKSTKKTWYIRTY
jgi:LCP family protein required for cell wall assembly